MGFRPQRPEDQDTVEEIQQAVDYLTREAEKQIREIREDLKDRQ